MTDSVRICIIGAGVAGISLLLLLQDAGFDLSSVALIDPHFDGGDLARKWGGIISNTPWSKTIDAVRTTCSSLPLQNVESRFASAATTPLIELARLLRDVADPAIKRTRLCYGVANAATFSQDKKTWSVQYSSAGHTCFLETRILIITTGAEPRDLALPIPSIPLDIALCPRRINQYVRPGQRVVVFGTAHSGTLVIRNLLEHCAAQVYVLYKPPKPFFWDRDGEYDGLKAEAAEIADAITRGDYTGRGLNIGSVEDVTALVKATRTADWAVYATGFVPRSCLHLSIAEKEVSVTAYDGGTGKLLEAPQAWGFGIAYPNRAPDSIHWDVSIAAFLIHAKRQLSSILEHAAS